MKYFLVLTVIGCCSCAKSLTGEYVETFAPPGGSATYHFHRDGTFEYRSTYDVGGEKGNGTYKYRFGRLKPTFKGEYSTPYSAASWGFSKRDNSNQDHNFHVRVVDEHRDPLPFAIGYYTKTVDTIRIGFVTDLEGQASLNFTSEVDSVELHIRYTSYGRFDKLIELNKYDSLSLQLFPNPDFLMTAIDSGTIWNFRVVHPQLKSMDLVETRIDTIEYQDYTLRREKREIVHRLKKE